MTESTVSGKCLCGQITVTVPQSTFNKTENTGLCFCKNCRQGGGCVAAYSLHLPQKDVQIQSQPKIYQDSNTDSGLTLSRAFCGNCGSPIYIINPRYAGIIGVRMGIFEQIPKPGVDIYCKDKPD